MSGTTCFLAELVGTALLILLGNGVVANVLLEKSGYYNSSVAGVKTGTTSKAGNCLVSVFTVQEEQYLCIVMNSSYYGKFTDTQKLFEVCAAAE